MPQRSGTRIDSSSHSYGQRKPTMSRQPGPNSGSTNNRTFPIRTLQSQRRVATPTSFPYVPPSTYHLRRKTPNGTIDAAYDGSPTPPFLGGPPHKQTILPVSADPSPLFLPEPTWHPKIQAIPLGMQLSAHSDGFRPPIQYLPNRESWRQASSFQSPLGSLPYQYSNAAYPDLALNSYQPIIRANENNVGAFCPPPQPTADALPFGQGAWQPGPSIWGTPGPGIPLQAHPHALNGDFTKFWAPSTVYRNPTLANSYATYGLSETAPPHSNLERLSLEPIGIEFQGLSGFSYESQPRFKERALSEAHDAYMDLLTHAQPVRRFQPPKANDILQPSSKLFVYPKPPNPVSLSKLHIVGNGVAESSHANPGKFSNRNGQRRGGVPRTVYTPSRQHNARTGGPNDIGPSQRMDYGYTYQPGNMQPYSTQVSPNFQVRENLIFPSNPHPVAKAKFSLEVISSLCEQDGWQWIDGMLVGGCLNYGLGNYNEACEWFSRVIDTNPSDVVAVTNIAATLYCLDRHEEAEREWLRAVKLCPSYLEAVEHLVGLLYRKRSTEAIDVIDFVQESLHIQVSSAGLESSASAGHFNGRQHCHLPETMGAQDLDARRHGFGSSGYALPGTENGRILALVHAKGTMLYTQKLVEQASRAFEEAVLISVGRRIDNIGHLVRRIQAVLSPHNELVASERQKTQRLQHPLLLPPEKARRTAQLVFFDNGELPGLTLVPHGPAKRGATQTTSNSLLSLAKILQDGMSNGTAGSNLLRQPTGVSDILALYYLSLSLQESPSTANNVGILLAGIQQTAPVRRSSTMIDSSLATIPGVPPGSGIALALAYYQYGLRLDPKHVHLHTNLGSLLKDIGHLDLAIQMYEQAVSCDGNFDIALTNLANAVKDRGRVSDAIAYYRRAVKSNPNFVEAVCGLFTALNSVCDWKGRGGVVLESGKFDRWHVGEDGSLRDSRASQSASGLARRVVDIVRIQLDEASRWGCDTLHEDIIDLLVGDMADVYSETAENLRYWLRRWKGKPWEGSRLLRLAERAARVKLRRWYHDRYVSGVKSVPQYWRPRLPPNLTIPAAPTVLPFHTFTCPLDPQVIRSISQRNAARISCSTLKSSWLPSTIYPPPPPPEPQLNIGYLSSDFNNHPLAHLMQSVFGFHNPRRARAICYATTASDKSCYRQKIEREAPVFRDVSNWPPEKLVDQIVADQIHILVNLNGYTRGARNEIFAARPAPIQMSFMGFAGTLGAEWCDYILADLTAIPPTTLRPWRENVALESVFQDGTEGEGGSWVYSENIIFCRDTFFCCDHAQSCDADERQVTWEQEQARRWRMRREIFPTLSDNNIILGNFNQLYKIDPTTFRTWLRILARVPRAILWLLRFPELGESNLRSTAEKWAGPEVASRLIFTDVAPKGQHISRAKVCDIFLDTPECNAHTTAADVLWSSTPILTYSRYPYKMCSRMAASILRGALPKSQEGQEAAVELIVADEEEYELTAIRLAETLIYRVGHEGYGIGKGRLADIRKLLWVSRWNCALFDTRRWVDDLETAYEEAWRKWTSGEGGDIYL